MHKILKNIRIYRSLLIGDSLVIALITITGFAFHGEMDRLNRMLSTYIPLVFAWFFIAPFFGLFKEESIRTPAQLWRVLWAMVAVVPLATWLRSLWLNTPILSIFILVLWSISAIAMLIWRGIYLILLNRGRHSYG